MLRGWAAEYEQHSPFRPFADAFADLDARALRALPVLAELPRYCEATSKDPAGRVQVTVSVCTRRPRPYWAGSAAPAWW